MSSGLPALDAEGVLWVAALDLVPIDKRTEWVTATLARVEQINAARAAVDYSGLGESVPCAFAGCPRRLARSAFGGPQFCSKEHRDAA